MNNKTYLEQLLRTKVLEKKELETNHRINIALFNSQSKMLQEQIDSIESQLSEGRED